MKGKWESFKKVLRGNEILDPDDASKQFDREKAKYEQAMKLMEQDRNISNLRNL